MICKRWFRNLSDNGQGKVPLTDCYNFSFLHFVARSWSVGIRQQSGVVWWTHQLGAQYVALPVLYSLAQSQGHDRVYWTRELRQSNGQGTSWIWKMFPEGERVVWSLYGCPLPKQHGSSYYFSSLANICDVSLGTRSGVVSTHACDEPGHWRRRKWAKWNEKPSGEAGKHHKTGVHFVDTTRRTQGTGTALTLDCERAKS